MKNLLPLLIYSGFRHLVFSVIYNYITLVPRAGKMSDVWGLMYAGLSTPLHKQGGAGGGSWPQKKPSPNDRYNRGWRLVERWIAQCKEKFAPFHYARMQDGSDWFIFYYQFSIHTAKVQGFFVTSKYLGSYLTIAPFFNARVIQLSCGYASLLKLLTRWKSVIYLNNLRLFCGFL